MNRYPLWKNLLVVTVILGGVLLALPNLFGDDPALQITREDGSPMLGVTLSGVRATLEEQEIEFLEAELEGDAAIVRFPDVEVQLRGSDALREALPLHVVALTLAPRTPPLLRMLGLKPMSLGLDLRGGVHFLYQVDLETALRQFLESYEASLRTDLREAGIRNRITLVGDVLDIPILEPEKLDAAAELIRRLDPLLTVTPGALKASSNTTRLRKPRRVRSFSSTKVHTDSLRSAMLRS